MFDHWNRASVRMALAVVATAATVIAVEAGGPLRNPFRQATSVEKLAKQLDHLEREFQYTGRVMVKTPDVWGQARLTAHREEFEREMLKQLDKFTPTLNAEIAIADQAFLSQALSVSAASAGGAVPPGPNGAAPVAPEVNIQNLNTLTSNPTSEDGTPPNIITRSEPNKLLQTPSPFASATFSLEPEIILDQRKRYLDHLHEIRRMNEGDDTADSPGYSLNLVRLPVSIIPGDHTRENYGAEVTMIAEPHVTEELLPTTFRQLVINDLIDQLSLPIVKVLDITWKDFLREEQIERQTIRENTAQAEARIREAETTLAKLQDLEQCLRQSMEVDLSGETADEQLVSLLQKCKLSTPALLAQADFFGKYLMSDGQVASAPAASAPAAAREENLPPMSWDALFSTSLWNAVQKAQRSRLPPLPVLGPGPAPAPPVPEGAGVTNRSTTQQAAFQVEGIDVAPSLPVMVSQEELKAIAIEAAESALQQAVAQTKQNLGNAQMLLTEAVKQAAIGATTPTPRERRSRYALPPTQVIAAIGAEQFKEIVRAVFRARDRFACRDRVQLADVQSFLRSEFEAAYDTLNSLSQLQTDAALPGYGTTNGDNDWQPFDVWCSEVFPAAADLRHMALLEDRREAYFDAMPFTGVRSHRAPQMLSGAQDVGTENASEGIRLQTRNTFTKELMIAARNDTESRIVVEALNLSQSLGWAILLESALLNQQLNADLKQVSQDPNCGCVYAPDCEFQFYGPNPPPEARQAFIQYVKCRWPIRVFALDPVTQQQNVADTFSLRREGQLAIALAFSQGRANAQSLTRYMRRIEQDIRTVSLNNTHVGFGAGDDTFGWRFYPRVQTPDIESNVKTVGRDLIWGGPNRDAKLKRWRIEPGMRECVALVVMPSFIKHVRFDVRTNWFQLVPCATSEIAKKGQNGVTVKHTVEWSRELQAIENSMSACIQDEHLYRPGEVERMIKRGQQLSRQMPLNTMYAQVPYENTLGGFEMFSSGVTDLAPELVGFYGSPGVDPARPTTLFLVGDNFSIHDTRVLAGNQLVETKMLSREVIQVDIPANVRIDRRLCQPREQSQPCCNADCNDLYVEVRLATPYGVSSPLYVPVVQENGLQQSKCCQPAVGDGAAGPTPLSNPLNCQPEKPKLPPQALWGRTGLAVQYLLAKGSAGEISEDGSRTLSQSPHVVTIVSPADRQLPAAASDKPAHLRVWIHSVNGSQLVPADLLIDEANALITGGVVTLNAEIYKTLHQRLRSQVFSLYGGQVPPTIQTLNIELKAEVVPNGANTVAVDGSLPVTIEVVPPGP